MLRKHTEMLNINGKIHTHTYREREKERERDTWRECLWIKDRKRQRVKIVLDDRNVGIQKS